MSAVLPDPASLERPWVASYPPGVPPTYRLPDVTLPRFLDDAARDFPAGDAVVVPGAGTVDAAGLRARVDQLATALVDLGLRAGDRVLVGLPNGHTAPVALLALWRLGVVAVPVDPATRPDRIADVVDDADVVGVIGTRPVLDALLDRMALPAVSVLVDGPQWPENRRRSRLRTVLAPPRIGPMRRATDAPDIARLAALVAQDGARDLPPGPGADDPAVIAYRPRTPGLRGVVLTHANLVANAFQTRLWIPDIQAGRERILLADGLHGIVPMTMGLLTGLLSAAALVLLDEPSPGELARAIERDRPTWLPIDPHRLEQLAIDGDAGRRDLSSLRVILAVGGPVRPELAAELERRSGGARVREGYGLAEAGPLTHAQPVYGRVTPGAMGLPVTSTVATVVDPDEPARRCRPGEPGLLAVTGPQIAASYWRREASDAGTFVEGWVLTDDLVTVDESGVFRHVARLDEVIRRADVLVSPRQVESVLERHAEVARAGVVGDESSGLLVAAVVPRRRARPDPDELLAHCRAHLDSPSVPDRVTMVDELPQDDHGELDRGQLRRDLVGR